MALICNFVANTIFLILYYVICEDVVVVVCDNGEVFVFLFFVSL